jgi:hypothetical protein
MNKNEGMLEGFTIKERLQPAMPERCRNHDRVLSVSTVVADENISHYSLRPSWKGFSTVGFFCSKACKAIRDPDGSCALEHHLDSALSLPPYSTSYTTLVIPLKIFFGDTLLA